MVYLDVIGSIFLKTRPIRRSVSDRGPFRRTDFRRATGRKTPVAGPRQEPPNVASDRSERKDSRV